MSLISILTIRAYVIISIFISIIKTIFSCCSGINLLFSLDEMQMQTISQFYPLPWVTVMHSAFIIIIMQKCACQFLNNNLHGFFSKIFSLHPQLMSAVENSMY